MSYENSTTKSIRHNLGKPATWDLKGDVNLSNSDGQKEFSEQAKLRAQEHEITYLRWQVAQAYVKELQLLNEKYALERKFSDLRMAMDEKQKESITSALNEIAHRKVHLDLNVTLTNDLKDADEQRYIFMTSLLGLLAEHGIWPGMANASSISMSVKLYNRLHQNIQEKTRELRNFAQDHFYEDNSQASSVNFQSPYQPMISRFLTHQKVSEKGESSLSSHHTFEHAPPINNMWPEEQNAGHLQLSDEGPGIEGFQIIGDAKPGGKLLGCGICVRGTSLCMFQWVRHLQDGTRQYIEGATNPEYVVTADDVDKCIAVECIPMDENDRQGELVRRFANDQNKITCEPDMQAEIDSYISRGQANFVVLVLLDSLEHWEEATFILRRSGFQVKINKTDTVQIAEKFSENMSIKIPAGLSSQFVLTCSDGTSHPFSTFNDIRMRDTLVLTIRMFQSKALDDRKKTKGHE